MKFLKIKETCLYIHNLEQAKSFYHDVLELPIIAYVEAKHIFFRAGSSVLLCFNPSDSRHKTSPPAHYAEGKQHFAFEVRTEDFEDSKAWLEAKGIRITDTVTWKSGAKSYYFEDPEGNVLEILPDSGVWD
jgi:catechol 2,3-dioxygenase-like lactoylglutathione lyase family enzyme